MVATSSQIVVDRTPTIGDGMAQTSAPQSGDIYLSFNGQDSYVEIPGTDDLSPATTGELTIAVWMRPDTLNFPQPEGTGYIHWLGKGRRGRAGVGAPHV